mmetsp:Transcript_46141/g.128367  ORF Transcript_46141/g.128367 Transcript_46141/m.128367 type:complete len:80 (+) Transcript_46141:1859-2098(+)
MVAYGFDGSHLTGANVCSTVNNTICTLAKYLRISGIVIPHASLVHGDDLHSVAVARLGLGLRYGTGCLWLKGQLSAAWP